MCSGRGIWHTALIVFVEEDFGYIAAAVLDDVVEGEVEIGREFDGKLLLEIKVVFGEIDGEQLSHELTDYTGDEA